MTVDLMAMSKQFLLRVENSNNSTTVMKECRKVNLCNINISNFMFFANNRYNVTFYFFLDPYLN